MKGSAIGSSHNECLRDKSLSLSGLRVLHIFFHISHIFHILRTFFHIISHGGNLQCGLLWYGNGEDEEPSVLEASAVPTANSAQLTDRGSRGVNRRVHVSSKKERHAANWTKLLPEMKDVYLRGLEHNPIRPEAYIPPEVPACTCATKLESGYCIRLPPDHYFCITGLFSFMESEISFTHIIRGTSFQSSLTNSIDAASPFSFLFPDDRNND